MSGEHHSAAEPNQEPNFDPSDEESPPVGTDIPSDSASISGDLLGSSVATPGAAALFWHRRGTAVLLWQRQEMVAPLGQRRGTTLVCQQSPLSTETPCSWRIEWSELNSRGHKQLVANQASIGRTCKQAGAVDAQNTKARKDAAFRAQVKAAVTATDDECR